MRTFNVRLAAIVLAVSVVFGGGVYLLHGYQVRRNAKTFLDQVDRAEKRAAAAAKKKDEWHEHKARLDAIKYLSWYVRLMPKKVDSLERLGLMMAEQAQAGKLLIDRRMFLQAFGHLERALRQDPERKAARQQLVKMAILARRFQDAKEHLQVLLRESPKDPELLEQLGQCQAETGNVDAALDTLKKAVQYGPAQLTAYEKLAAQFRSPRLWQPKEADRWMEKLVAANPKSARAHYLRGRYLMDAGQGADALKEATKALELAPDDSDAILLAATCYMNQGQPNKAREHLDRGMKLYPANADMYRTKAEVEARLGNPDQAVAVLRQGLQATKRVAELPDGSGATEENRALLWNTANLLIDLNRFKEARQVIDDLRKASFSKENIDYLAARIEFVEGHWLAAREGFEAVRSAAIDPRTDLGRSGRVRQIDLWIGQCYAQLGNRNRQVEACRRCLSIDPFYAPARGALIDALLVMGRIDEAIEEFKQLATRGKLSPAAAVQLARLLLLRSLRQEPARQDWAAVERALDEADKAVPDSPDVVLLRAEMLRAQDHAADAEKLLHEARAKDPKQSAFLLALIASAERRADWAETGKLLGGLKTLLGDGPVQRLQQAQYLVRRQGKEATADLRKLADNTEKFSDAQRLQLWSGLMDATMQVGDTQQAEYFCRKIAEKQPSNVQVRYLLFERALAAGDQADTKKALAEIERVAGQDAHWLYGKAMLLLLRSELDKDKDVLKQKDAFEQALDCLNKAREQQADWSRIPLVTAGVYLALGKPEQAMANYREAIDMGDRSHVAMLRLLQLLQQTGRSAEADKWFHQFEREQGERLPPDLGRAGAEIAMALGNTDRAVEMARKAVGAESKNCLEQFWLAQVLGVAGRQAKAAEQEKKAEGLLADAEKAGRRAVELEPKRPQSWVTLVRFLAAIGEEGKAEKATQEASRRIPENEAPLALAQCYEAMNKIDLAEEKYKAAMAAAPQNMSIVRALTEFHIRAGKIEAAEAQLQRVLDGKLPAKKEELAWARGQQAMIYFARGGHQNLLKARELIQKNFSDGEPSILDRRLDYVIDASDPDPSRRGAAVRKMEEMVKNQSAAPEDRFSLAQMYLAAGDWNKASDEFRSLVTTSEKESRYLVAYIAALLQHGETSSAEMYLDRLEALVPGQFLAVSLRADLLLAKKEPRKALAILTEFIDKAGVQAKDRAARGRLVAEKLVQLGPKLAGQKQKPLAEEFARQADTLYRAYLKQNPGQELLLATFLGSQGKIDEALDLLEQKLEQSAPYDFARACSVIWQGGNKFSAAQVERLDGIVQKAIRKFDRRATLLLVMAELRSRQARYADAEAFYREVLKKNSGDAVAMNNLAVLLALQGIKLDEALKLMNQAVETAGQVGAMLDSRASVYMALNDPDKALKDIHAALADAETPVRLFHLAQACQLSGQEKEARDALDKALQKGLTAGMLQSLELPAFEKLRRLPR